MALDPDEAPRIAQVHIVTLKRILVAFLLSHKSPDFIGLDIRHRDVADLGIKERFATLARVHHRFGDGLLVQAGNPRGASRSSDRKSTRLNSSHLGISYA